MNMIVTIVCVLLVAWFLGFIIFPVLGALIHVLLVVAVIVVLWRIIQGKNPFK